MPNKNTLFAPCLTSSFKTSFKLSFPGRDDLGERVQSNEHSLISITLPCHIYHFALHSQKLFHAKEWPLLGTSNNKHFLTHLVLGCDIYQLEYLIPSPVESAKSVRSRWGIDSFWNHPIEKKPSYQCIGNCQNNGNLFIAHLPKTYNHFVEA